MSVPVLLLLVGVPPTPSSLRVRVWRRLRSLGAVPLKRSAYLLPDTPDRYEDFQWLAQEIQRDGGDATLVRVQQIENISPAEVLQLFHAPRDEDYKQLAARYRKLLQSLDRKTASTSTRTDALMLFRQASKLVVRAGARTRRFPIETLEQLAVARGQVLVVLVARRVEELEHLGRADVLDLLHAHQRGVAAVALDLLSEPLKVLVPIRRVGQEVRGALERDGAQRAQPPPDPHTQARGRRWHAHQQEKNLLLAHDVE